MAQKKSNKKEIALSGLDAKTRELFLSLSMQFIKGVTGKTLGEISLLMSVFTCATLEQICNMLGQEPYEFLHDHAELLLEGIDEISPDNVA